MIIVLMGYMGSGKSLIGKLLSTEIESEYLDFDEYIEANEGKSISEIFKDRGEIYFRKKESEYLNKVLESNTKLIVSLGGGTPCFAGNMDVIKKHQYVTSVYLHASLEELTDRLFKERSKRPLIDHIESRDSLKDFIRKHLFERSFYYNQAAHIVKTDSKTPEEIVAEIQELLF